MAVAAFPPCDAWPAILKLQHSRTNPAAYLTFDEVPPQWLTTRPATIITRRCLVPPPGLPALSGRNESSQPRALMVFLIFTQGHTNPATQPALLRGTV